MNILVDYISAQGYINGGAEYTKRIIKELYDKTCKRDDVKLFALFDSYKKFVGNTKGEYDSFFHKWVDIRKIKDLGEYTKKNKIDVFFIGILQRFVEFNLTNIDCKTVVVMHDAGGTELERNYIYKLKPYKDAKECIKTCIKEILNYLKIRKLSDSSIQIDKHKDFLLKNNVFLVTVSFFSKCSLQYNHPFLRKKNIYVFYSPLREKKDENSVPRVQNVLKRDGRYFLALSEDRWAKNVSMIIDVFRALTLDYPNYYLVTTGSLGSQFDNHIGLPYVSDGELAFLMRNSEALIFASFTEGFGLPPIEAMRYGIPIISTREAALTEILDDSAMFFSPLHRCDLYDKVVSFIHMDRSLLSKKSQKRFEEVSKKQVQDLSTLVDLILN